MAIVSLLPNPVGDDNELETVTLRNRGTNSVSLFGWTLRDRSGGTWALTGALAPGASRTFRRGGQAMSLNNAGDEIALVDPMNAAVHTVTYESVDEGELVRPAVP